MSGLTAYFTAFLCTKSLKFIALDSFKVLNYAEHPNNTDKVTDGQRSRSGKHILK